MKKIVLFGSGGHAKVIVDIIEKEGLYKILGFIDPNRPLGAEFVGYPVLGSDNEMLDLIKTHSIDGGIIAIGDNWARYLIVQNILKFIPDFHFKRLKLVS